MAGERPPQRALDEVGGRATRVRIRRRACGQSGRVRRDLDADAAGCRERVPLHVVEAEREPAEGVGAAREVLVVPVGAAVDAFQIDAQIAGRRPGRRTRAPPTHAHAAGVARRRNSRTASARNGSAESTPPTQPCPCGSRRFQSHMLNAIWTR